MSADRIVVSGLRVFAHHGVLPSEAEHGQVFVLDLELEVDLAAAGASDDLDATVDYGALVAGVTGVVGATRRKLIEAVAEDVARFILADARVVEARVRVTKPHAPIGADAVVAVEIVRGHGAPTPPSGRRQ